MSRLAISSIAWSRDEEQLVAEQLQKLGVTNVEIAPTKVWDDPLKVTDTEIRKYKEFWDGYGINIVAFQSMLFTRPDLKIFADGRSRQETLSVLGSYIELAGKMGVQTLVFGSPKNRQRGSLSVDEADTLAVTFFNQLGDVAQANNTTFSIEPNPTDYACDYITNAFQGMQLVKRVNNPGFKLHLDIAGMTLARDNISQSIYDSVNVLQHFHISAPMLGQVEAGDVQHEVAAQALVDAGYKGLVSIEMRPGEVGQNVERVTKAVTFAKEVYKTYLG